MQSGNCRLCERDVELQLSHIIPAFSYRWLRQSSGNGHIRSTREPNRRVQDGLKRYWLCPTCEGLFSKDETLFANNLFHPYLSGSREAFSYSGWLLRFCVSVSWRVLRFYRDEGHLSSWEPEAQRRVEAAERAWRDVLLGVRPHPGQHTQHLLPLDRIESATGDLEPNINRYLMRAIHIDVCRGSRSILTYAKMGRFIIIGFVHEPSPQQWKGTKVHATSGVVEPRHYIVPSALGGYLNEKARELRESKNALSDRQRERVEQSFRTGADRLVGSDSFLAIQADVDLFGEQAFNTEVGQSSDEF